MEPITYRIIRSNRKTSAIQITPLGQVLVRCPKTMSRRAIDAMIAEKADWIEKHLQNCQKTTQLPPFTDGELRTLAARAKVIIPRRAAYFAPLVGVSYGRIAIRAQKTRWGSCSSKGNLNFNCLLVLAPPEVLDYVVVHELCHRKQLNHSPAFWREVERILPDYRKHRSWLKTEGNHLIVRIPHV